MRESLRAVDQLGGHIEQIYSRLQAVEVQPVANQAFIEKGLHGAFQLMNEVG